jgi:2,4'-dihydroxyacetophenone dioxygenase
MATDLAPATIHRSETDLPFIDTGNGTAIQLLQVDLATGIWVVRARFDPGITLQRHRHTGHVLAFTQTGSWYYLESPDQMSVAGSYLYEPAGSVHTLHVPASNPGVTDVWFSIHGANLNLDDDDRIDSVVDAHSILASYTYLCEQQRGLSDPPVIVVGTSPI